MVPPRQLLALRRAGSGAADPSAVSLKKVAGHPLEIPALLLKLTGHRTAAAKTHYAGRKVSRELRGLLLTEVPGTEGHYIIPKKMQDRALRRVVDNPEALVTMLSVPVPGATVSTQLMKRRAIKRINKDLAKSRRSLLEKSSATRQVKVLRKLLQEGREEEAQLLTQELQRRGVLKVTNQGTNVKRLGYGAEAVADVVVGAKGAEPLAVRKALDPKGPLYSPGALAEKVNAYRRLRKMEAGQDWAGLVGGLRKGQRGGRYLITQYVPHSEPVVDPYGMVKDHVRNVLSSPSRKARVASAATGKTVHREDILAARAKKREPIIREFQRRGLSRSEAEQRALRMIPERGGPDIQDLHSDNIRAVNGQVKVLDFNAVPAHRLQDIKDVGAAVDQQIERGVPLQRAKQLHSRVWGARMGRQPKADDIGSWQERSLWGGVRTRIGGLVGGPKEGPEAVQRALHGLGNGSRQVKKVRGAKTEAMSPIRQRVEEQMAQAQAQAEIHAARRKRALQVVGGTVGVAGIGGAAAYAHRRTQQSGTSVSSEFLKAAFALRLPEKALLEKGAGLRRVQRLGKAYEKNPVAGKLRDALERASEKHVRSAERRRNAFPSHGGGEDGVVWMRDDLEDWKKAVRDPVGDFVSRHIARRPPLRGGIEDPGRATQRSYQASKKRKKPPHGYSNDPLLRAERRLKNKQWARQELQELLKRPRQPRQGPIKIRFGGTKFDPGPDLPLGAQLDSGVAADTYTPIVRRKKLQKTSRGKEPGLKKKAWVSPTSKVRRLLLGTGGGAVVGGVAGASGDDDRHRLRNAVVGVLGGAAVGALTGRGYHALRPVKRSRVSGWAQPLSNQGYDYIFVDGKRVARPPQGPDPDLAKYNEWLKDSGAGEFFSHSRAMGRDVQVIHDSPYVQVHRSGDTFRVLLHPNERDVAGRQSPLQGYRRMENTPENIRGLVREVKALRGKVTDRTFPDIDGVDPTKKAALRKQAARPISMLRGQRNKVRWWYLNAKGNPVHPRTLGPREEGAAAAAGDYYRPWKQSESHLHAGGAEGIHYFGKLQEARAELKRAQRGKSLLKTARAGHWRTLQPNEQGHDEQGGELFGKTWVKETLKEGITLRSHQTPALKALEEAPERGLVLAMGTGTGKTPTSIVLTEKLRERGKVDRVLVLLPKALDDNFIRSGIKRFTSSSVQAPKRPEDVGDTTYVVVGIENFRSNPQAWIDAVQPDMLLADEVHRAKDPKSVTYKALMTARKQIPYFLGLTGSVVSNKPEEVESMVDLASGKENSLGGPGRFRSRYTEKVRSYPGGIFGGQVTERRMKNTKELGERLKGHVYYVGRKDVKELPTTEEEVVKVEMTRRQKKLVEKALGGVDPSVRRSIANRVLPGSDKGLLSVLSSIQKARGISGSVREGDPALTLVQAVEETPKLKRIIGDAVQHMEETPDGRVVMFTNRVRGGVHELAAGLEAKGIPVAVFSGKGEATKQYGDRHENVKRFLSGEAHVIIVSPAGVEGLNLNTATMFQLADEHYNPEKNQQAIARAVRADSLPDRAPEDRKVLVRRYQSVQPRGFMDRMLRREPKGSVDEWVHALQGRKEKLNNEFRDVLDGTYQERQNQRQSGLFGWVFGR